MPLTTRSVSPVNLSLHRLPDSVRQDELQCITNGTFANLIRQLSSLSRHAQQIFSDIHREVLKIDHRTNTLFLRVERLAQKVAQQSQNSLDQSKLIFLNVLGQIGRFVENIAGTFIYTRKV